MKRIAGLISIMAVMLICLCACGKSEAVKNAESLINSIGEVTLDKLSAIELAENTYNLVPEEEKKDVKNYDKLVAAREYYDDIKDFSTKAAELEKLLDSVLTQYGTGHAEVLGLFDELKARYDSADDTKKALYAFDGIIEKADNYKACFEAAAPSAVCYIKGFLEVNKEKTLTVTDIGCIAQTVTDNDSDEELVYYLFAMKYTENGEEKEVYSTARFPGTPSVASFVANAQVFYCDKPISEKMDALKLPNVILDASKVIAEATA